MMMSRLFFFFLVCFICSLAAYFAGLVYVELCWHLALWCGFIGFFSLFLRLNTDISAEGGQ